MSETIDRLRLTATDRVRLARSGVASFPDMHENGEIKLSPRIMEAMRAAEDDGDGPAKKVQRTRLIA